MNCCACPHRHHGSALSIQLKSLFFLVFAVVVVVGFCFCFLFLLLFFLGMECMNCNHLVGEEVVLRLLKSEQAKEKYKLFLLNDQVKVRNSLLLVQYLPMFPTNKMTVGANVLMNYQVCGKSRCSQTFLFKSCRPF